MATNTPSRTPAWRRHAWLFAWLFAVACVNFVPQHGWDASAGPVVPHDSFPADCSLCHEGSDWHTLKADFTFDHEAKTGVPLLGAHATASCLMCHNDRGPVQQFAARGCAGCHADPHFTRLGANCESCHDERTWYPREAIVLHDRTRFPLVGAHAAVSCFRCHPGAQVGNFAGASAICFDCHQNEYLGTTAPNHQTVSFPQQCDECHLPVAWRPARFDHPASFPLTQGHGGLLCSQCHTTANSFTGLSTDCASCHTDDYTAAVQPNHPAAGLGTQCEQCHDTSTFLHSSWPHPGTFALTFGHAGRKCTDCHVGQSYMGTSSDCVACHLDDYQGVQNPNHVTSGFGTDCLGCHNTATWHGATFSHPASFPLENAHQRACTDCHTTPGVFAGLNPACVACHLTNYTNAANPPHASFGLSQQCQDCHGTVNWGAGNWNHHFPINSGAHAGLACFDCHDDPNNRPAFACINCHTHSQNTTNNHHNGVNGYVYTTAGCYACHPNGHGG